MYSYLRNYGVFNEGKILNFSQIEEKTALHYVALIFFFFFLL